MKFKKGSYHSLIIVIGMFAVLGSALIKDSVKFIDGEGFWIRLGISVLALTIVAASFQRLWIKYGKKQIKETKKAYEGTSLHQLPSGQTFIVRTQKQEGKGLFIRANFPEKEESGEIRNFLIVEKFLNSDETEIITLPENKPIRVNRTNFHTIHKDEDCSQKISQEKVYFVFDIQKPNLREIQDQKD